MPSNHTIFEPSPAFIASAKVSLEQEYNLAMSHGMDLVGASPDAAHATIGSQEPRVRPIYRVLKTGIVGLCPAALNDDTHAII